MAYENPICPKCDHRFTDEEIWYNANGCEFPENGLTFSFACPICETRLSVCADYTPRWDIELDEDYNGIP